MSAKFTIPTVFTAIDKFSAPVKKMGQNVSKFANKADKGLARMERGFRKLTPGFGAAQKQMLSMVGTAAIMGAVIGGISFSVKSIKDYEDALASTQAITGASNDEFKAFKSQIEDVAKSTKKSSVEVARGFEVVGSAAPELLKNSEALGAVTNAAITLSKASGDDLATSAQSLTGVMNQFSMTGGAAAERTMNVLAAGSVAGSANITQVGEAMKNFGSVAASANLSLEESVALVEVMGKFSLFGAEAGTKLRGSVSALQKAGLGYTSGLFNTNDALEEAKKKFDSLATAKQKDAYVSKVFGETNKATGLILLNNTKLFGEYTKAVDGTNIANEQAEVKSNTLSNRLDEMKAGWVNMITGSGGATKALDGVKKAVVFVTENMETIVSVGGKLLLFLGAVKVALLVARGAMMVYSAVTKIVTAVTWLWNAALTANPLGALIAVLAGVAAGIGVVSAMMSKQTTAQKLQNEVHERALDNTIDQRVEITMLFAALRKAKVGSDEYTKTLEKLETIQPGIVKQYNLQAGALRDINRAEQDLTASIMKRAEAEARAEMIKEKVKEGLEAQTAQAGFWDDLFDISTFGVGPQFAERQQMEAQASFNQADILAQQQAQAELEPDPLSSKQAQTDAISKQVTENNSNLTIDFKNMPQGVQASGDVGTNISIPNLSSTK